MKEQERERERERERKKERNINIKRHREGMREKVKKTHVFIAFFDKFTTRKDEKEVREEENNCHIPYKEKEKGRKEERKKERKKNKEEKEREREREKMSERERRKEKKARKIRRIKKKHLIFHDLLQHEQDSPVRFDSLSSLHS
jgi:hypothetical protein